MAEVRRTEPLRLGRRVGGSIDNVAEALIYLVDANILLCATDARPTGNLVPDAHLAALALEHGQTIASADSDLSFVTTPETPSTRGRSAPRGSFGGARATPSVPLVPLGAGEGCAGEGGR